LQIFISNFLIYNHENALETLYKTIYLTVQYILCDNLDLLINKCHIY
jgi:hypothetical protein